MRNRRHHFARPQAGCLFRPETARRCEGQPWPDAAFPPVHDGNQPRFVPMFNQTSRLPVACRRVIPVDQEDLPPLEQGARMPAKLSGGPAELAPRAGAAGSVASPLSSPRLVSRTSPPGGPGGVTPPVDRFVAVALDEPASVAPGAGTPTWREWAVASAGHMSSLAAQTVSAGAARLWGPVTANDLQQARHDLMSELGRSCPPSARNVRALGQGSGLTAAAFDPLIQAFAGAVIGPSNDSERQAQAVLDAYIARGELPCGDGAPAPEAVALAQQVAEEAHAAVMQAELQQGRAGRAAGAPAGREGICAGGEAGGGRRHPASGDHGCVEALG